MDYFMAKPGRNLRQLRWGLHKVGLWDFDAWEFRFSNLGHDSIALKFQGNIIELVQLLFTLKEIDCNSLEL